MDFLVMDCINTVSYSLLINGSPEGFYYSPRGFDEGILYPHSFSSFAWNLPLDTSMLCLPTLKITLGFYRPLEVSESPILSLLTIALSLPKLLLLQIGRFDMFWATLLMLLAFKLISTSTPFTSLLELKTLQKLISVMFFKFNIDLLEVGT